MDFDDRTAGAADDRRPSVTPELGIPAAGASPDASSLARRRQRRTLRIGGVVAVLAVVGLLAVAAAQAPPDRTGDAAIEAPEPALVTDGELADDAASGAAILGALPRGPIDGRESWRLPVVAHPRVGLGDGDTITVYGRGWAPDEWLGIVQCSSEADTGNEGVAACELGANGSFDSVTYTYARADGTVVADVVVRRTITTPAGGEIDCTSAAERCLIGVGAVSDYDKSGGAYIDFAGSPPFPEPSVTVSPDGPHVPGAEVTVDVAGWMPERAVRLEQCRGDRCQVLLDGRADETGAFSTTVVLGDVVVDDAGEVACGDGCVLRANGIGVEGGSSAPLPDDLPLSFTDGPSVTVLPTTPPATSGDPAPPADPPPTTPAPGPDPGGVATTAPPPPGGTAPPRPPNPGPTTTKPPTTTLVPDGPLPPGGS